MSTVITGPPRPRHPTPPDLSWIRRLVRADDRDLQVTGAALALGAAMVGAIAFQAGAAIVAIAVLGAAVVAPGVGLATLAFLAPLKEPLVVPPPGFNFALVGAIVLGCVFRLPIDRPRLSLNLVLVTFAAFVLYAGLQQLPQMLAGYPGDEDHAGFLFFQLVSVLGAVVAAAYLLPGRSPYPVVVAALAGAMLAIAIAIATYVDVGLPPIVNLSEFSGLESVRASGPFQNPNYMGLFTATALVTAAGLWPVWPSRGARLALVSVMVVLGAGVALSQSRGAILALLAGLAVLVLARHRVLAVALIILGVVSAVVIYPAFTEWRLTNLRGEVTGAGYVAWAASDGFRLAATLVGPALFLSSPVFGVGLGQYADLSVVVGGLTSRSSAHNYYMNVLAEQGIVGVTLWIVIILGLLTQLRASTHTPWRTLGFAVLVSVLCAGIFLDPPNSFQTVALPALIITAALVADWRRAAGDATSGSLEGAPTGSPPAPWVG